MGTSYWWLYLRSKPASDASVTLRITGHRSFVFAVLKGVFAMMRSQAEEFTVRNRSRLAK